MSEKTKNLILFMIMVLIWSTTWAALKIGLEDTPPAVGLSVRFAIAAVVLITLCKIRKIKFLFTSAHIRLYLIVGIFNMALSYFFTYYGTQFIPSSLSSILWSTMPIMLGIQAHFFIQEEKLNLTRFFAILIATIGVMMILSDQKLIINKKVLSGSLIVLLAVFMGTFPNIYTKKFKPGYNPLVLTGMAMAIASIFHALYAAFMQQWQTANWTLASIGSAVYLGIFGSAVTFSIYYYLIRKMSVVKVSFLTFITPITASIIGWIFLNETITFKEMLGCFIIFSGIFLYDFRKYLNYFTKRKGLNG